MKSVVITGGSGFIGTALCRQLKNASVPFKIIDLKPSHSFSDHCIIGDVRDAKRLRECLDGDVIIHLAAVHRDDIRDPATYYDTNVNGTRIVSEIATEKGIRRIIFTSSVAVYGFAPPGTDETGEIAPFNDYGKSKFEAENVLRDWCYKNSASNHLTIIRPTVVFGEGNRGNVYNLLHQIATNRFIMVGHGQNRKSMAYVENLAAFLVNVASSSYKYRLFNYVDYPDLTMNELVTATRQKLFGKTTIRARLPYKVGLSLGYLADFIAWITGRRLPVSSIRIRKFCADTAFSSTNSQSVDFVPPFTLQEGLARTIEADFISPVPNRQVFFTE